MYLLYLFIAILVIKLLINVSGYFQCKWYLSKYQKYIKKPEWDFVEQSPQVVRLFKNAGIEDSIISNVESIGFGYFQTSHPSVLNNITNTRNDIVSVVLHMFHQSIGVYRSRMLETINPVYWIEIIIFLPKHTLNYLGVSPESAIIKITQIIYWAVVTITGFILGVYKTEIELFIRDWATRLTQ